ncbi:RING finger protein 151 [Rhinophrynus dorsalis]
MRCPVMISCGHIFCRKCILQWLKRQQTCPCCRTETKGKLYVLMHKLKRKINQLAVKCPYEQNGCPAHFPLLSYDDHASSCAFEMLECYNEGCPAEVLRKDMCQHSESCEYWRQRCHMGCGTMLSPENREQHNCYRELKEDYTRQVQKLRLKARSMARISSQINRQIQLISDRLASTQPTTDSMAIE